MFYFRQILPCQFLFKIFTIQSILSLPITSSQKICIRQKKKKTPRKVFKKGKRSFPGTNQSYKKSRLSRARRECLKVCFDQLFDPLLDGLYPENSHEKSLAPSTNGVWPASPYRQQHFISKLKIYAIYNPSNSIGFPRSSFQNRLLKRATCVHSGMRFADGILYSVFSLQVLVKRHG